MYATTQCRYLRISIKFLYEYAIFFVLFLPTSRETKKSRLPKNRDKLSRKLAEAHTTHMAVNPRNSPNTTRLGSNSEDSLASTAQLVPSLRESPRHFLEGRSSLKVY